MRTIEKLLNLVGTVALSFALWAAFAVLIGATGAMLWRALTFGWGLVA